MIADIVFRLRLFARHPGLSGTASWLAARGAAQADPAEAMRAE